MLEANLGLFFSKSVSLKLLDEIGIFAREMEPYHVLAGRFRKIYFFTYGGRSDREYANRLPENVEIVPRRSVRSRIYFFLLPLLRARSIKACQVLKTDQMDGALPAVVSSLIYRQKLIIRTGYIWSRHHQWVELSGLRRIIIPFWIRMVEKLSYRFCQAAIVTSSSDKTYLLEKYGLAASKIHVIPNYINPQVFRSLKVPKQKDKVLFVGRLAAIKQPSLVVRALAGTGFGLDIIGAGPLKSELSVLCRNLGVPVKFLGLVPNYELPRYYNRYPVYVISSRFEGNPKSLLEAMACQTACVGTDVIGIREVLTDGKSGLLVKPDYLSMRAAIQRLMCDKALRDNLGFNARHYVLEHNNFFRLIKREIELYAQIVHSSRFDPDGKKD